MAIGYTTYTAKNPLSTTGGKLGVNALNRWLTQQKQAQAQFGAAQQPLQQAVQMFQPGGGYGQGQATLLQDQARQAQAEALSNQVATGMSSGSLATGTGLRVKKDLAQGLAGVEDTRTQFLAQALQALASARQGQAQTTASVNDPVTAPLLSYISNVMGMQSNEAQNVLGLNAASRNYGGAAPVSNNNYGGAYTGSYPNFSR